MVHAAHFVTTVTSERGSWFVERDHCRGVLQAFEDCRAALGVLCVGYVLMPDHFHALVVQTSEELQIPELMRRFKRKTSVASRPKLYTGKTLWKRRYDDVIVPGSRALWTKLDYMHWNPVKKKLCKNPQDYPWSSAASYFFNSQHGEVVLMRELITPLLS